MEHSHWSCSVWVEGSVFLRFVAEQRNICLTELQQQLYARVEPFWSFLYLFGKFWSVSQTAAGANSTEHHSAVRPHLKETDTLSTMEIIMNLSSQHLHSAGF